MFPHWPHGNTILLAKRLGRLEIIYVKPLERCEAQGKMPQLLGSGFGFSLISFSWQGRQLSGIPKFILPEGDLGESAPRQAAETFSGPSFLSKGCISAEGLTQGRG